MSSTDINGEANAPPPGWLKWVKLSIVVMTALILGAIALIAVEVWRRATITDADSVQRSSRIGATDRTFAPPVPIVAEGGALILPSGGRLVEQVPVDGGLAVRVDYRGAGSVIYFLRPQAQGAEVKILLAVPN